MLIVIHGYSVHSDKGLDQVVGSRINFADGSWCDVISGQSVNKGSGYIKIYSADGNLISSQCISGDSCSQVAIGKNVVQQQSGGTNIIIVR